MLVESEGEKKSQNANLLKVFTDENIAISNEYQPLSPPSKNNLCLFHLNYKSPKK